MDKQPLCVDLDGTLVRTNTLLETALLAIKKNPFFLAELILSLLKGKAHTKHVIGNRFSEIATPLPYNEEFLSWIKKEHKNGRVLVLATASDLAIAQHVAQDLGIFCEIIASTPALSVTASGKAEILRAKFGIGNFSYAGNSTSDLAVWKHAKSAILVNTTESIDAEVVKHTPIEASFQREYMPTLNSIWNTMRIHQWVKNTLLFIPALTAHSLLAPGIAIHAILGFLSFSLLASAVYIFNDIADLPSDRLHATKRKRPIASSNISIAHALLLGASSAGLGIIIAYATLPVSFMAILGLYIIINIFYSLLAKRTPYADIVILAGLYVLRVVAGGFATGITTSKWLFLFVLFFFLSLAIVKRVIELVRLEPAQTKVHGRGYLKHHQGILEVLGKTSAALSIIVLGFYMQSPTISHLYSRPSLLWMPVLIISIWMVRIWHLALNKQLPDDPVLFAAKDFISYAATALALTIMFLAS